jgi:hypothetical protein
MSNRIFVLLRWMGCGLGLCLFSAALCAPSSADIRSIQLIPQNPTTRDSITVTVSGYFSDGCWATGHVSWENRPDSLTFNLSTTDHWRYGLRCPLEITPYSFSNRYPPLAPGQYVVAATEWHDSLRLPLPVTVSLPFDVIPATATCSIRWGYLKGLFR